MKFSWPESARNELRVVERQTAIRLLHVLTEYGDSGVGDVKMLTEFGIDPSLIARFTAWSQNHLTEFSVSMNL